MSNYTKKLLISLFLFIVCISLILLFYKRFYGPEFSVKENYNLEQIYQKNNLIPVAILGSGPAGQSAGIYASRLGFKTLIIEGSKAGGQLTETSYVENWP